MREDETPAQFAIRIAADLDNTVLAIQGPPGAGKTYTGARMICELVRKGARVGVTAVSHKVIGNLLEAVMKAADELGIQVSLRSNKRRMRRRQGLRRLPPMMRPWPDWPISKPTSWVEPLGSGQTQKP